MDSCNQRSRRVVLIGWDAADWKLITPLLDDGLLPNLARLIERGVMGKMATMEPPLSPLLWTSAVTGMKPDRHGILGFLEPDPITGGVRHITSNSRKVKALWNILHQSGMRSIVVNWYASHPSEPIRGAVVSDLYPKVTGPHGVPWPLAPQCIHPASLVETFAELRVHPSDLKGEDLAPFIPNLARIDQTKDSGPGVLARILAENLSVHAAATWAMENEEWDFLAVFYDLIDHAGHAFMRFHPPAMPGRSQEDCENYKHVMNSVYRYQDLMLGRIMQLAGEDSTIIVMSDHGMHSDHLRPTGEAIFRPETPTQAHRSHGVFCMAGPGVRHDELVYGAELVDVAPTILTILGLPSGEDMQGRILVEAFLQAPELSTIPSWEDVPGECGRNLDRQPDPWDATAAIQTLADLGYVDKPSEDQQLMVRKARQHYDFNLARFYLSARRIQEALPLFESLAQEEPDQLTYVLHLAQCYYQLGRLDECRRIVEPALPKDPNQPAGELIMANVYLAEGRTEEALALLLKAETGSKPAPSIRYLIGRAYMKQEQFENAARTFESVIKLDPDHAKAWCGLAEALLQQKKPEEAADAAMDAIRLQFELPAAHLTLGAALAKTGRIERAIQAFETCLILSPKTPAAHRWLAAIHEQVTRDVERASQHRVMAERCLVSA